MFATTRKVAKDKTAKAFLNEESDIILEGECKGQILHDIRKADT